jgi:Stress responsive A/B Barrel Domain
VTLRHVACFAWKHTMTDAELVHLEQLLAALPAQIPEIRAYRFGRDLDLSETSLDFAITADFDDADGWRAYQAHPAHREVLELVLPRARQRVGVQFEMPDGA